MFLIKIKSRYGRLTGDNAAWTWIGGDGRRRVDDNPIRLPNLKTKRLKDLLSRQPAFRTRDVPFIQPLVFCSAPGLDCKVADFILDHFRYECPTGAFQDWEAHHSTMGSRRLVRLYLASNQATKEDRQAIVDASKREFHIACGQR